MESQRFQGFTRLRQWDIGTNVKWSRSGINLSPECRRLLGRGYSVVCVCRSCGGETCDRSSSTVYTADLLTS